MKVEVRGIHLTVTERMKSFIDKKVSRIDFAKDLIVDLLVRLLREGSGFKCEATINFRWGNATHMEVDCYDIYEGIDKLFDKMEVKINREKGKIQEHKRSDSEAS